MVVSEVKISIFISKTVLGRSKQHDLNYFQLFKSFYFFSIEID